MPFDPVLAARVRRLLARRRNIDEKTMFGGVGFLMNGNMLVGVWKDSLIVRLGPKQAAAALEESFVREFDITGRAMQGWVMVADAGVADDDELQKWIDRARKFVGTLPAK